MGHHLLSDKVSPLLCFAACLSSVLPLASPLFCRSPLLCFAAHRSSVLPLVACLSSVLLLAVRLSSVLPLAACLSSVLPLATHLSSVLPLAARLSSVAVAVISNSCCLVLLLFYLSPSLLHCPCQWSPLPPITGHQPLSSPSTAIAVNHSCHCHY